MLSRVAAAGSFQTGFLPLLVRRSGVRPATVAPNSAHAMAAALLTEDGPQNPQKHVFWFGFFYIGNTDINFSFAKLLFPQ